MDSKSFGFLLIYFLILSYAAVFSDLWLTTSVSLIFYFSFCAVLCFFGTKHMYYIYNTEKDLVNTTHLDVSQVSFSGNQTQYAVRS